MNTIHVLSIGNSFSEDAQAYLHDLAASQGVSIESANLFIGGCSLERHFRNMHSQRKDYMLQINGHRAVGFYVNLEEALTARSWDYITLQQASPGSHREESYAPYLGELAAYVRRLCPKARILIHQTWGYETGSLRLEQQGYQTFGEMFRQVKLCYEKAALSIGADGIIPAGEAFSHALNLGLAQVHRDTYHAKLGVGRFILALVWYGYLTGADVRAVDFHRFAEPVSEEEYRIAIDAAHHALNGQ